MKSQKSLLLLFAFTGFMSLLSCLKNNTIEIPLTQINGYGHFSSALRGITPYSDEEDDPWAKTYLKVSGAPDDWTEMSYGAIETNIYQSVYQNYFNGNITRERYEELQKSWNWNPDTLELTSEILKTKIAFVYGKDSTGKLKMIVDANNNCDFSDDQIFTPVEVAYVKNKDSLVAENSIMVTYEKLLNSKKVSVTAPLFVAQMSQFNMLMCNFPQHSVGTYKGEKIAVSSNVFMDLSYNNPDIAIINDSLKDGDIISADNLIAKNEFIEIKGVSYKNKGVSLNNNSLILERVDAPRNELQSTQKGYKSFDFKGTEFTSGSSLSSDDLRGKYVLIDFWAVWCGPCRQGFPNLRKLYNKTDREKFEIVGIIGNSQIEDIGTVIRSDSVSWPQIVSTDSNKIKETFSVNSYPTSFLIDPEGIIIAKNLRGEEMVSKVMMLLND